ncbi:zinc-dependent metalloprotease [Rhodothermus marinus]|uniref:T9SS type A sorting domain-containing protein n=1 Tax=Rhodothermus marinus (strain ATCC 43812 / DSM 4252 / R-10) TaxID=518766 RepID=D0MD22_RHOM4|nr:zinc-dependent metalloprotease [Rhodothermus marinus]ACY48934.1 hypothetical protein Rmar_2053 [Rhodothermus marinus DSM 4252]
MLLLGLWLALSTTLQAQPVPLFEAVSASLQALGPQAQQRQQVLQKLPMVQQLQVVRLPAQLWRYRSFELAVNAAGRLVPGHGKGLGTLTVRRGELSVLSEEAVAWNGRIYVGSDTSEAVGEVSLVVLRTGAVTGQVLLGDAEYWVRPLGGGLHALVTIDPSKYPKERPTSPYHDGGGPGEAGLNDAAESVQPEKAVEHETQATSMGSCAQEEAAAAGAVVQSRCSPEVVRVLVLYTPAAAQGRDIDGIIYAALNDANQAYRNSQINNLELRLVHKRSFSFTVQSIPEDDVEQLASDAQAQALRDQYQADVVVLLIDSNVGRWDSTYGVAGVILSGTTGEQLRNIGEANQKAYAIVQVDYASAGQYTLAHEIGHIQGARHDPEDDNYCCPEVGVPYGRGNRFSVYSCDPFWPFKCGRDYYATIMAYTWRWMYPDRYYQRIRYFSSPNVTYRGVTIGSSDRNNARVLRETADVVADFRDPNELRATFFYTSDNFPYEGTYTFTAQPCGGRGTLSYQWRKCADPFTCGPVLGTGATFTTYLAPGSNYIQLTVQSSAGQAYTALREVYVLDSSCGEEIFCAQAVGGDTLQVVQERLSAERLPAAPELEGLYPNPAGDRVVVRFGLPEASEVELMVYDVLGRAVVRRRPGRMEAGWHREVLMTDGWPAGRYVVVLRVGERTLSKTLMRIR